MQKYIFGLILLICLIGVVNVQAAPVTAEVEVTRTKITLGDQIWFTLTVTPEAGIPLGVIDPISALVDSGGFEIIEQLFPEDENTSPLVWKFKITSFEIGKTTIPPIEIPYQLADGGTKSIQTNAIDLEVKSVIPEGDSAKEIRPIKPVVAMKVNYLPYILLGVGILLLVALSIFFWKKFHKPTPEPVLPRKIIPSVPPHIWANQELDRIEDLHLPEQGDFKEHYTLVSDCIRRYIELRWRIDALEQTTYELSISLKPLEQIAMTIKDEIIQFLETSDLIKFAKVTPDLTDSRQLITMARQIVAQTKPTITDTTPTTRISEDQISTEERT